MIFLLKFEPFMCDLPPFVFLDPGQGWDGIGV